MWALDRKRLSVIGFVQFSLLGATLYTRLVLLRRVRFVSNFPAAKCKRFKSLVLSLATKSTSLSLRLRFCASVP